ncbi:MAG: hypothetical protein JXA67_13290 [Micromonosporaceae bacterium]|nr:hypothetical protein [Micromonosporaceae bacterium]
MSFFSWLFPRTGPDRFVRQVIGRLRAAGIRKAVYHPDQFAIEYRARPDQDSVWMYLGNLYAECQRDPGSSMDRIERFVGTFISPPAIPAVWEEAQPLLRPVLRGASFGRGGPMAHTAVLRRPALPYLDELVVVDQPTSMGYVAEGMWGVPAEQVFAVARANLARVVPPGPAADATFGSAALTFFDAGDSYVVSRLLLSAWLGDLAGEIGGRPVAFVPHPTLMVVVRDEEAVLGGMFEAMLEEYVQAARPLSPMGYTLDDSACLVPYPAGGGGRRLRAAVRRAERSLAAVEYETQRSVLTDDEALRGCTVASCMMVRRGGETAFTIASWGGGAPTLLPAADYIAIDDQNGVGCADGRGGEGGRGGGGTEGGRDAAGTDVLVVPFQALLDEEFLIEAVEYRPTRYWVEPGARSDALARLRSRAVQL